MATLPNFFSTIMTSIQKKKLEQYNHAEKLKIQFSASMVDIYECKKRNGARDSWKVVISHWSKSSNTSL